MTDTQDLDVLEEREKLVVHITADITLGNVAAIHAAILEGWRDRITARGVIVNLSEVRHIDSSGIGALIDLARSGVPLSLFGLRESHRRLLDRMGLAGLFQIDAAAEDAENALPWRQQ